MEVGEEDLPVLVGSLSKVCWILWAGQELSLMQNPLGLIWGKDDSSGPLCLLLLPPDAPALPMGYSLSDPYPPILYPQTLFNPNKTVVKMFLVTYDFQDMPANHMTFLRHRIFLVPVGKEKGATVACSEPPGTGPPRRVLCYLMHLR